MLGLLRRLLFDQIIMLLVYLGLLLLMMLYRHVVQLVRYTLFVVDNQGSYYNYTNRYRFQFDLTNQHYYNQHIVVIVKMLIVLG